MYLYIIAYTFAGKHLIGTRLRPKYDSRSNQNLVVALQGSLHKEVPVGLGIKVQGLRLVYGLGPGFIAVLAGWDVV